MKGFNLSSWVDANTALQYCRSISALGCDTVRYQLSIETNEQQNNRSTFNTWLDARISRLKTLAQQCWSERLGLQFIADLHSPFGGTDSKTHHHKCLYLSDFREHWIFDIQKLCRELAPCTNIFAIEPINEPSISSVAEWKERCRFLVNLIPPLTTKQIVIPCLGIGPREMRSMIKLPKRQFIATCHFWPRDLSLVGTDVGPSEPDGKERKKIVNGVFLNPLKDAAEYRSRMGVPVLIGEIGCARPIGDENQVRYLQKTAKFCLSNKMGVLVHTYDLAAPIWRYDETGALEALEGVFRKNAAA